MDLKSNKSTTGSISTTTVNGSEWNQLIAENNNALSAAGITASSSDLTQLKQSIQTIAKNKYKANKESEEWQKHSDWIDIRSGALPNSIYFLYGHPADFSAYDKCGWTVTVSSGQYNVFIDNNLYGTYNSGTAFNIQWSTANITTGRNVTYPSNLVTHVIRITPATSTATITAISHVAVTSDTKIGVLWAHLQLTNKINLTDFCGKYTPSVGPVLLEAVTAEGDKILCSGLQNAFGPGADIATVVAYHPCIKYYPEFDFDNQTIEITGAFAGNTLRNGAKVIRLKNGQNGEWSTSMFCNNVSLQYIKTDNFKFVLKTNTGMRMFRENLSLKELPSIDFSSCERFENFATNMVNLNPTVLDLQNATISTKIEFNGDSTHFISGLKGILFSSSSTFAGGSPQINVSYTGLDRTALVKMFNSMPYNVGYTVVGSPTINNEVASGFGENDYLQMSNLFPSNVNSFEASIKFNCSDLSGNNTLFSSVSLAALPFGLSIRTTGVMRCYFGNPGNSTDSTTSFVTNTDYLAKLSYVKNTGWTLLTSSDNGISWTTEFSNLARNLAPTPGYVTIGRNDAGTNKEPFVGSIDLSYTYINVNGVPWFRGTPAMTKTCNIVGCTGTSDLTQDNKDIVLNKGWSLTVS